MVFHSVGGKPRLNKVKVSGGRHRFLEEIYRAKLDKIWAQMRLGVFDWKQQRTGTKPVLTSIYLYGQSSFSLKASKNVLILVCTLMISRFRFSYCS
ncbi:hypothetical protein [Siminovitchia terrae]|uniref:hypothetical protein n=1 Tax=Siminovitchia terrae TaxID=1914933 RepID=UPI001BB44C80|nr:hypothetical protein [Siminovitchia terrae]